MDPRTKINEDLKEAMRGKDSRRVMLIRGIMAAFKDAEQRKREDLVKAALKKHNVARPSSSDEAAMSAYDKAVSNAVTADKVAENAALDEADVMGVIQKLIKMRQDSIAEAEKVGRADIVQSEQSELDLLQVYLPKQLSREEVESEARSIIAQVGASSARDMGKVMGPLMGKLKGKADSKIISDVVKSLLEA
jgi:hypothetical protein